MSIYRNKKGDKVDVKCYIYTRPNLRNSNDELIMQVGYGVLQNCFDKLVVDEKTTYIKIQYPERWLNILEQRVLYERVFHYYPNIEYLEIVTHSVYIIQCTYNGYAYICDKATDYPDGNSTPTTRFCPEEKECTGLRIFKL